MEQVTIIGSNTLLAKHLVKLMEDEHPRVSIKLWNDDWSLYEAVHGSDIVFNLHEAQDFSVIPDMRKLQKENVQFVTTLLETCKKAQCQLIVHLSTTYLQCSTKWPNIDGREAKSFDLYRREWPFPDYCATKERAEQQIGSADFIGRLIVRIGPMYGEYDRHSLVCDSILMTSMCGSVPHITHSGAFQFTYAGNAAHAMLSCARKMMDLMREEPAEMSGTDNGEKQKPSETVIICDHTPLRDIYSILLEPIVEDDSPTLELSISKSKWSKFASNYKDDNYDNQSEEDNKTCYESIEQLEMVPPMKMDENNQQKPSTVETEIKQQQSDTTTNIRLCNWRLPFWLFYFPYWLLSVCVWTCNKLFGVNSSLNKLPSPHCFYLLLRHWTVYSGYKLRIFFDWRPPHDWETSLERSRAYYRQLKPEQICGPSWLPEN